MTSMDECSRQFREDEGGGVCRNRADESPASTGASSQQLQQGPSNEATESRLQQLQYGINDYVDDDVRLSDADNEGDDEDDDCDDDDDDDQYEQAMDIFVKHFDHQHKHDKNGDANQPHPRHHNHQQHHHHIHQRQDGCARLRERRPSLPSEDIELTTFSGVVMLRKQQLQARSQHQTRPSHQTATGPQAANEDGPASQRQQQHLMPPLTKPIKSNRPLSISSISSAASSGSSASSNSSSSSGIHSSLTRNSSLNYSQEFKRNYSYLESAESLDGAGPGLGAGVSALADRQIRPSKPSQTDASSNDCPAPAGANISPSFIEQALKSLNLSAKDNHLAQTRATILAAGELQRRSFNVHQAPGCPDANKLSRINRSLHSSLRYDKSTAYRIHLMANTRGFSLGGQSKSYNLSSAGEQSSSSLDSKGGVFCRYSSSSVSRNNSSTSSDSGHSGGSRLTPQCCCGASRKLSDGNQSIVSADHHATSPSSFASASTGNQKDLEATIAGKKHLFKGKSATLDGAACQRSSPARGAAGNHHPSCPSYDSPGSTTAEGFARPLRASPKLQQSPSSVSSYSNNSSLFRDDGFEDDLTGTASERSSSIVMTGCNFHSSLRAPHHQTQTPSNSYHQHPRHRIHNEIELPLLSIGQRVVTEIIETERSYVDDLDQIVSGYLCRLRDSLAKHDELFSNLEDVYKFNKDFLFQLEECYLNPGTIAACFVENANKFDVYTHYCTMYPKVVSTLTELMAEPDSAQMLKERQLQLNHSLPLGAYLLKPVQRILKYHILFKSLIKHTADDETLNEKDRHSINEAFSVMTNIACHINEMKKRHEHSIRVQELQSLLYGWEGPDLTTLGDLILEDTFKQFNRHKSNRHLLLFDNVLMMTKKKRDGSLHYKGHIECSNLMLIETIDGQPLVFNTVPFDNPKALRAFQADNLEKKRDWCLQMKEVIIKSFEVKIPTHVRDLLMSLTKTSTSSTTPDSSNPKKSSSSEKAGRVLRAPNYLEKKRAKQQQDKISNSKSKHL